MLDPAFISLLEESVGADAAATTVEALAGAPSVSVRLNPAKLRECPFPGAAPVPWSPYGYLLKERPAFTLDPLLHTGCYYVQDSSSMYVGEVFRRVLAVLDAARPSVLDLCAAPGGKTTDLAASLRERFGEGFSLLANELIRSRFQILRENVRRWGDARVGVTSLPAGAFTGEGDFDIVLADVPCSGEGMFRKDPRAVSEWSPEAVQTCAARSRGIVSDAWPALRPGGFLVYSTCTFNHFENDDNVAWIAETLGASVRSGLLPDMPGVTRTAHGAVLLPGRVPGEGQYVAVLQKNGDSPASGDDPLLKYQAEIPVTQQDAALPRWDLDLAAARLYLHGDAVKLPPEAPRGPILLTYLGHVLGPAKNIGTRCNNLYPKAWRIRMDV